MFRLKEFSLFSYASLRAASRKTSPTVGCGKTTLLISAQLSLRVIAMARPKIISDMGLAAPETVELCWKLNEVGFDLPLTRLNADECAQTLYEALKV